MTQQYVTFSHPNEEIENYDWLKYIKFSNIRLKIHRIKFIRTLSHAGKLLEKRTFSARRWLRYNQRWGRDVVCSVIYYNHYIIKQFSFEWVVVFGFDFRNLFLFLLFLIIFYRFLHIQLIRNYAFFCISFCFDLFSLLFTLHVLLHLEN